MRVGCALFNRAHTLGALDRSDDAIAVYDDFAARYGDATEPGLRELLPTAQANKRELLLRQA